jgi:hypothetical protein
MLILLRSEAMKSQVLLIFGRFTENILFNGKIVLKLDSKD